MDGAGGGMGRGCRGSQAAGAEKGWERQGRFLPFGFSCHRASCGICTALPARAELLQVTGQCPLFF